MRHLLISLLILLQMHWTAGDIKCHQCLDITGDCKDDPQYLGRCQEGTTMCYVIADKYGKFFERGCLARNTPQWLTCIVKRDNSCFSCYGSGCNGMAISIEPSQTYCTRCSNYYQCKDERSASRCEKADWMFGPQHCFSRYNKKGEVVQKGCINDQDLNRTENIFKCSGSVCNYGHKEHFQRCTKYTGHPIQYNRTKVQYCNGIKALSTSFLGCYHELGKTVTGADEVKFGCNTERQFHYIEKCLGSNSKCNMCESDLCNNVTNPLFFNTCKKGVNLIDYCNYKESMCYFYRDSVGMLQRGCVRDNLRGLYLADTLMCSNEKLGDNDCGSLEFSDDLRGCYECSHQPCNDVLFTLGHTARTICPRGTTQCYSARSLDGITYRGCYTGYSEGVKICKNAIGACRICSNNNCNVEKVVTLRGQCYKSNWQRWDHHETTLRFSDCTGYTFTGTPDYCYIAASSRLFMRMGCVSELVSGIDDSYLITYGGTEVAWLYPNSCYKCISNSEGFCLDVSYLKQETCMGLNKYPVRGCYTWINRREHRLERGCITELSEYMMQICDMPIFFEKCRICQDSGCNNENYENNFYL